MASPTSSATSAAPPVLPLPRQPSPLSFSSAGHGHGHDDHYFLQPSNRSSPVPSVFESDDRSSEISDGNNAYLQPHSHSQGGRAASSSSSTSIIIPGPAGEGAAGGGQGKIPIEPVPDSLIYRTTLKQLESQTVTLKRLSKTVLSNLATVSGIYDQLDSAEDELMGSLGELSRWLGHGYGLRPGVWDEDRGVKEVRREKRKRQKEDMEVMVHQSVENVRGELKRRGLAGGGATAKYEKAQQGYYSQTGAYLAPASTNIPSSQSTHSLHINSKSPIPSSDKAQTARTAQIEALSYQHHSALLYATPPSSLVCLDLLVSLHSWAGTILPETGIPHPSHPVEPDTASTASTTPRIPSGLATPARIISRPQATSSGMNSLKLTLAESLASMASVRSELLHCWSLRNTQQQVLEDRATRKQAEVDGTWNVIDSPAVPPGWTGPVTSSTHHASGSGSGSKPKRTHHHKVHRSVGGRLRDLLSTSSSYSLANSERGGGGVGGSAAGGPRTSADLNLNLNLNPRPGGSSRMRTESVPEHSVMESSSLIRRQSDSTATSMTPPRPAFVSRHSVQLDRETDYRSPITITASEGPLPSPSRPPMEMMHGDRGEVGRKHEGVLWGPGTWEGLGRPNSKSKWEMTWVVLDHSKIYEYGGIDTNRYDCQAVIDLRFASVREGRDTDRRFVFEVISAKSGRRLYQATSEVELKMWVYAIANAIESCINGTSSVRTFDDSKLRTSSGALDDHALPARRGHKPLGLGFPLPPIPSTPGNRRSMPPLGHSHTDLHLRERLRDGDRDRDREKRTRKTSFKNVLKSSGEKWLNRHSTSTTFDIPRPPAQPQPTTASASASVTTTPRPEAISRPSMSSNSGRTTPPPQPQSQSQISGTSTASPSRSMKESWDGYDSSHDTTIEARVYEMAGLGLGGSPVSSPLQSRRVQSEGVNKHLQLDPGRGELSMSRSKSADMDRNKAQGPEMTMKTLRELADKAGNNICADCKRPTKASQWATLNLRGVPMVMFLCIRCCGLHRGLGTHISKPRAINLDHWSPESIKLAWEWGNVRGNGIWERNRPPTAIPNDENISSYIRDKYVEGRWLSPEDRYKFTWAETGNVSGNVNVGRAF